MTQFLPPNLLALFAPRDPHPLPAPPGEAAAREAPQPALQRHRALHPRVRAPPNHNQPYSGIAPYIREFEPPPNHNQPYSGIAPYIREFEVTLNPKTPLNPQTPTSTSSKCPPNPPIAPLNPNPPKAPISDPRDAPPPDPRRDAGGANGAKGTAGPPKNGRREKIERRQQEVESELKMWDPHNDPNAQGDAFKTLFVARVNYDTTESKLRREFEVYGPIKRIYMVYNKRSGKPRGYAFIEYEHERDMHSAYKHADGKKIDGRRVLVDVERGRTVKGWRPRRLGGGLGGTRRGGADVNIRHSGRDDTSRYDE
ncbi:hypothetical protein Q9233_017881, partial [Columba guinea]